MPTPPDAGQQVRISTLVGIVLIAVILRLLHLHQTMRYDEAYSFLHYAMAPLRLAISDYTYPGNHLLNSFLGWISTRVFGEAEWSMRLPAFLAGTALVPLVYLVARRLSESNGGLIAAALAAALPSLILYSTNARGYAFVSLAFLVQILLADSLASEDSTKEWILFAVVTTLGAYAVPVMMYPTGAAILWLLIERRRRNPQRWMQLLPRLAGALALAGVATAILYVPVIRHSGLESLTSNDFVTAFTWPAFFAELPKFLRWTYEALAFGVPVAVALALAVAMIVAVVRNDDDKRTARITLALATVLSCVLILVVTRRPPPGRVLLYMVPLMCVFAGIGVASIINAWVRSAQLAPRVTIAVAVLFALGIGAQAVVRRVVVASHETDGDVGYPDTRSIATYLLGELQPHDRLVSIDNSPQLDFYFYLVGRRRLTEFRTRTSPDRLIVIVNEARHFTLDSVPPKVPSVDWTGFSRPRMLRHFANARVYELRADTTSER